MFKKTCVWLALVVMLSWAPFASAHMPNYVQIGVFVNAITKVSYFEYYDINNTHILKNNLAGVPVEQILVSTGETRYYVFGVSCTKHVYEWGRVMNAYTPNSTIAYYSKILPVSPHTDAAVLESLLCSN